MASKKKVQLLFVLASHLKSRHNLDPQMTFRTVMEFVGAGTEKFHEHVEKVRIFCMFTLPL